MKKKRKVKRNKLKQKKRPSRSVSRASHKKRVVRKKTARRSSSPKKSKGKVKITKNTKKEKEVKKNEIKSNVQIKATVKKRSMANGDTYRRDKGLSPMRIYLNQIEKIPLLTPDEEYKIAKKVKLKKAGWIDARREMIRRNLRLVINIGKRYMHMSLPFSDIVEEGNIGLMRAVDKFNYKRGYRFSTYASWWIKQSIMRALSNQGKLIRIPVHMFETMSRWRKVKDHLTQKYDRAPTPKEVAKVMKLPVEKVKELEKMVSRPSSLHAPVSIEGEVELIDLIEDEKHQMPHEETNQMFTEQRIEQLLNYVNERERKILEMRFGLNTHDTHTLEETAQQFHITRERVRQIEEAALKKIRYQMKLQNDKLEHYI